MVRYLSMLLVLCLGLVLAAACGDDDDDGDNGNGNATATEEAEATEEVVSQEQLCADGLAADSQINETLQVLTRATSDVSYEAMADPASESYVDVQRFRQAISHAARVPGTEGVVIALTQIADQLEQNLDSGQPFSDGSGGGEVLQNLVNANFVQIAVDYGGALEEAGCLGQPSPTAEAE